MPHVSTWFQEAKFGVFIHWLLRSAAGPERWRAAQDSADQRAANVELAGEFTAERYKPREWARLFSSWGARYAVLTSKHDSGLGLFDTPLGEFDSVRNTPAKRDLVGEYVEAMRSEGLKVGIYYHLGLASEQLWCDPRTDQKGWSRYVEEMHREVRHMCTAYGKIDLLWFDGDGNRTAAQWQTPRLVEMIESLQPGIVLNNRLRHPYLGHYSTPEQTPLLGPREGLWELCDTCGTAWWYEPDEEYKRPPELVRIFCDTIGLGGNYLLNVSPLGDGTIPARQSDLVGALGSWITSHSEAVHGTEGGLPPGLFGGSSTRRGTTLYLIAYDTPRDELVVKGLRSIPRRVEHMKSGKELSWRVGGSHPAFAAKQPGWLYIQLPGELAEEYATVVRVEFAEGALTVGSPHGREIRLQRWQ